MKRTSMMRIAGLASVVSALAALGTGCDNPSPPVIDTTSTTSAALPTLVADAGVAAPSFADPSAASSPLPVVNAMNTRAVDPTSSAGSSVEHNLGMTANAAQTGAAAAAAAPVAPVATATPATNQNVPSAVPGAAVDNHGNGTLGSGTGSHAFDTEPEPAQPQSAGSP